MCGSSVDEGPVFAMCMTGQGDQVALNQWISGLQLNNPILGRVPTLFRLNAGPRELQESGAGSASEKQREKHPNEPEPEFTDEEEPQKRQAMKPWTLNHDMKGMGKKKNIPFNC